MSGEMSRSADEILPNGQVRRSLALAQWPETVRERWVTYKNQCGREMAPTDLLGSFDEAVLQDHGPTSRKAHLASTTLDATQNVAGRWLLFAARNDYNCMPARKTVRAWLDIERSYGIAPVTVATEAFRLWRFSIVIWPDQDWGWFQTVWQTLKRQARPVKDKRPRLRSAWELEKLGFDLMNEAVSLYEDKGLTQRAAIQYRDGLVIAMLATKPLRIANMTDLSWSALVWQGDGSLHITIARTKNGDGDEALYGPEIAKAVEQWRDIFWPLLKPAADCDRLWIGRFGSPIAAGGLYQAVTKQTARAFGLSINPHLFRDCVAQTVARHSPDAAHVISKLLGHRDGTSAAPYIGTARIIGASVELDNILDAYRVPPAAGRRANTD